MRSLVDLCVSSIASTLERYPAEAFALLAPQEFTEIVKKRYECTLPKKRGLDASILTGFKILDDNSGRLTPCISAKVLDEIQEVNPHLRNIKALDDMVWKDCVNLRFKILGPSRPNALRLPWPILTNELKGISEWLTTTASNMNNFDVTNKDFMSELKRVSKVLSDTPMSIKVLNETKIGKAVSKFVKGLKGHACLVSDDVNSTNLIVSQTLNNIDQVLKSWKSLAAANGITTDTKRAENISTIPIVGKDKNTSNQQQFSDMKALEDIKSWYDLYMSLTAREECQKKNHGERMKTLRDGLAGKRKTVKEVRVLAKAGSKLASISSTSMKAHSKMNELKRQCKQSIVHHQTPSNFNCKKRSFAFQVATSKFSVSPAKRVKSGLKRDEIDLGRGKKMRMPIKQGSDVGSKVEDKLQRQSLSKNIARR